MRRSPRHHRRTAIGGDASRAAAQDRRSARAPRTGSPHGRREARHEFDRRSRKRTTSPRSTKCRRCCARRTDRGSSSSSSAPAWCRSTWPKWRRCSTTRSRCAIRANSCSNEFGVAGARGVTDMPDDAVKAYANDAASAIVALTHDPRIDDMGLMEALKTHAFYVGAMGSREDRRPGAASVCNCSTSPTQNSRACTRRSVCRSAAKRRRKSPSRSWPRSPPSGNSAKSRLSPTSQRSRRPRSHRKRGSPPPQRDRAARSSSPPASRAGSAATSASSSSSTNRC